MNRTIKELLGNRTIQGNLDVSIDHLNLCNRNTQYKSILSYATSDRYVEKVKENEAIQALIVPKGVTCYDGIMLSRNGAIIYSDTPEKDFYMVHERLCCEGDFYKKYEFLPIIGSNCKIHPTAVIDNGVEIGNNVKIGANTVIKKGTVVGDNVTIGCNSVIGSEGFQLITIENEPPMHITHVGGVHICEDVYIGDCTCVANSLFEGVTYIGKGAKIDNLVHVAHNLHIGENAVVIAHSILCGSSVIEDDAWVAPHSAILNNVVVGKRAMTGLGSVVLKNIPEGMLAYGFPATVKRER